MEPEVAGSAQSCLVVRCRRYRSQTMASQSKKYHTFRELHGRPGAFVIPNPWDAGTARILTALGFEALATTSAGFAFSIGRRDSAAALSRAEILHNARS